MDSRGETQDASKMQEVSLSNDNSQESGLQPPVSKRNSLKRFFEEKLKKSSSKKTGRPEKGSNNSTDIDEEVEGPTSGGKQSGAIPKKNSRFHFGLKSTPKAPQGGNHDVGTSTDSPTSSRNAVKTSISTYFSNVFKRKSKVNIKAPETHAATVVTPDNMGGGGRGFEEQHQLHAVGSDENSDSAANQTEGSSNDLVSKGSTEIEEEEANEGAEVMKKLTSELLMTNYGSTTTFDVTVKSEETVSFNVTVPKEQSDQEEESGDEDLGDNEPEEVMKAFSHNH